MGDDRPARYAEKQPDGGELIVYRASGLGGCPRAFVALAQGMIPEPWPADFQVYLDEGTAFEDPIRQRALEKWPVGRDVQFTDQVELNLHVMDGIVVRSHVDDLAIEGTSDGTIAWLREYKKLRISGWPRFLTQKVEIHHNYPWQVSAMMHALKQDGNTAVCEFIGGKVDKGELVDLERFVYQDPPLPLKAIIKKIAGIELLIEQGYDPSEVTCTNQYPCGFYKLHDEKPEVEKVELKDAAHLAVFTEWQRAASVVKTAKAMLADGETKKKAAHEALVAITGKAKKVSNGTVTLTRVTFDTEEQVITRKAFTTDYFKQPTEKGPMT